MMRFALALALALFSACGPERKPETPRDTTLDDLEAAAARIDRFRAFYELRDETTGEAVLLELAFRAPDLAMLHYPGSHRVVFSAGVCRFLTDRAWYEIPYLEEFRRAQERFAEALRLADEILGGGAGVSRPPQIVFDLGGWQTLRSPKTLTTLVTYSTSPARFGWLRSLRDPMYAHGGSRTFRADGDGASRPSVEIALDERGFLARARVLPPPRPGTTSNPGFTLELKSLSSDVPDDLFAPPARGEATDQSAKALDDLRATLANLLEWSIVDALWARFGPKWAEAPRERIRDLFAAYYRVDLERTYEPSAMIAMIRDGQEKVMAHARKEIEKAPDRKAATRYHLEKFRVQRGASLGEVDAFEDRILGDYRRFLLRKLRSCSKEFRDGLLEISDAGLASVVDEALRVPIGKIFDAHIEALEKDLRQ
jgi:hypothetical protein